MIRKIGIGFFILLFIGAGVFFGLVPRYIDKSMNTVVLDTDGSSSNVLYDSLTFVADLHCDMLLWNRNFFGLHRYGHVDLPRMQRSSMAFQVFTIVSKTPKGINIEKNDSTTDQIALLTFSQLRPPSSWFSLKARALHQCQQLHDFAAKSNGEFRVIASQRELKSFVSDRRRERKLTAGMLGLEGAHCLEGDVANLKAFYEAGVRYIGLAHFFDNEWAGSAHGVNKGGLTRAGKTLVREMEKLNLIIDLAHASTQTINEVLSLTSKPLIVSHTGVRGVCDNQRNLSDEHLLEIGRRNGLIGIGLWETAVCGTDAKATAKSIRYVADRIGVDKVALGSDFDGAIQTHFAVTGLSLMIEALQDEGFNAGEIEKIMGGNIRDFFLKNLPE